MFPPTPLIVNEFELMDKLCSGKAIVLPLLILKDPLFIVNVGLGTLTVKVLPVVGVTVAKPLPTISIFCIVN